MARPKTFDPDAKLDQAMDLFWHRGYAATSVRDLTVALGLGQGSLYGSFGSKDDLYAAALERYAARQASMLVAKLETDDDLRGTLRSFLIELAEADLGDPDRCGCLLVNAATERAGDPRTVKRVGRTMASIEVGLRDRLRLAQEQGDLSTEKDPAQIARTLTTFIQGLRVMGKARASRAFVLDAIDGALTTLD